ncbi:YbaN family protein [Megasphaera cerevisiae]|uniref:YbaN family protein n=1 Tax=Megasphaera cerevisiae TaxID=39029 RepID=UPI00094210C2|nr:YbaN family protein [Megasphaera cerevisiae]OKY52491.1 hypothetical protein BSR42_12590 [Megasphaera cerevisiae]
MTPEIKKKSRGLIRYCWITLGCLTLTLGTIGIVLPILPTVPFYMLTLFCFAKSSDRLHTWFIQSELYQKHLADFVQHRSMPLKSKLTIMGTVTGMMAIAIWAMQHMPEIQLLIAGVWFVHVLYFIFSIKTTR